MCENSFKNHAKKPLSLEPEARTRYYAHAINPEGHVVNEFDTRLYLYSSPEDLAEAAREMGIEVSRSQVRRILLREGVRWRRTRPWAQSADPEFVPKDRRSSACTRTRRPTPP